MKAAKVLKGTFAFLLGTFVLLGLNGCTVQQLDQATGPSPLLPVVAQQQPLDVAGRLTERYLSTLQTCSDGGPAYECSGVLVRRSNSSTFWVHSSAAAALGSVTFSYLRADASTSSADASGFIFMDKSTALQQGKSWFDPRCIYPFIAGTQNAGRPLNGCGFATRAAEAPLAQSTCEGLVIPAVTPELWIQNFERFGSNTRNQCSLSTRDASQFMTSLRVRGLLANLASTYLNEMLIPTWDVNTPEQLPIEAFFYNAAHPGSLISAQLLSHAYRVKTGLSLPIVRLDFAKPAAERFTLRAIDQEDGWQVADRLNARFANQARQCTDGRAPVYCSGVLVRATQYSTEFHAWNPKPNGRGVSFSYLRADVKTLKLFYPQGLIFDHLGDTAGPGLVAITPLCIFMSDANTWGRATLNGCGAESSYPSDSGPCASMNINDLTTLGAHFRNVPTDPTWRRLHHQCSLAIQPASFMLAIDGRAQLITGSESPYYGYNEILLGAWEQNIPDSLPLDAIFYTAQGDATALQQAKQIQQDLFSNSVSLIKPVVRLDLSGAAPAFSYRREDQSY